MNGTKKLTQTKKAQLNHVFTIIATLLVAGAIIAIGASMFGNLMGDKCTADSVNFKDDITGAIKNNNHYGSVTSEDFRTPCNYMTLCLVDKDAVASSAQLKMPDALDSQAKFVIADSVASGTQNNIFLISSDETVPVGFASNLVLDPKGEGILCIQPRSGKFSMVMKGKGQTTLVESKYDIELLGDSSSSQSGSTHTASQQIN